MTSGGCTFASTTQTVTLNPAQVITIAPTNICTNPITLTATAAGATTFAWTDPNGPVGTNSNVLSVTAPTGVARTYSVTASGPTTCPNTEDITITFSPFTASFTEVNTCSPVVTLNASPTGSNYSYTWNVGGVATPGSQNLNIPQANNGVAVGLLVTDRNTLCTSTVAPRNIPVLGTLTIVANFPNPLPCENQQFTITTTVNQPIGGATFTWSRNGTPISGQSGNQLVDNRGGTYQVDVTIAGCPGTSTVVITPAPSDPGQLLDEAVICPELANPDPTTRQVVLDAGPGFVTYDWSTGETTQTITVQQAGLFTVDLVNIFGCPSSDKTQVEVECDPKIVAPSAFRPASDVEGGSGLANREFGVLTYFIDDADFQVFIFNRWGEMVYQSNERAFRWNGGYNNMGPLLPAGTYSYVVRYKSSYRPEDGVKEKRGGVVLVR